MKPDGGAPDSLPAGTPDATSGDCELCRLDAMTCGQVATIVRLSGTPRTVRRLAALGMRPSARCELLGRSPAGGPLHLLAGSVHLMLRSDEAVAVLVRPEPDPADGDGLRSL